MLGVQQGTQLAVLGGERSVAAVEGAESDDEDFEMVEEISTLMVEEGGSFWVPMPFAGAQLAIVIKGRL